MDNIFNEDNCFYFENHTVQFITASGKTQETCIVKIFIEQVKESVEIKLILSNAKDESISYTSIVTPVSYRHMQTTQELHISFEQLAEEIKSLLLSSKMKKVIIKFTDIGTNIELGFYTMTSVKEIKLLCLDFIKTPLDNLVQYFKNRSINYAKRCDSLEEQLKSCQLSQEATIDQYKKEIEDLHEYYKNENKYLKHTFETYKSDLNNKLKTGAVKTDQLKSEISRLVEECKKYSIEIAHRDDLIKELYHDNNELKNAVKYMTVKSQQQMVSLEKYEKMKKLFSSTLTDLLKYQVCLKKIKDVSEIQKEENERLREDIKSCVSYIMNTCQDDNVLAKVVSDNKNVLETIGVLDNKLAQLNLES